MVRSGDSSSSWFQIERYLAPLADGRFTSTTRFKISHHNTRLVSITRRSERNREPEAQPAMIRYETIDSVLTGKESRAPADRDHMQRSVDTK